MLQDCIARGLQKNYIAIQKLYCDWRARLLGTLGRWVGAGRRRSVQAGVRGRTGAGRRRALGRAGGKGSQELGLAGRAGRGWQAGGTGLRARGVGGRSAAGRDRREAGRAARGRRGAGAGGARPGRWARSAWELGVRPRRWAGGLSARAGQGCALGALRLVFNPVFRLSIFPESLNEHCSL